MDQPTFGSVYVVVPAGRVGPLLGEAAGEEGVERTAVPPVRDPVPLAVGVADVLVTDYSSVMFDFVLTDRPVLLLVPDLEQYRDIERGFYFDIESRAPGPLLDTTDAVIDVPAPVCANVPYTSPAACPETGIRSATT